MAYDLRKQHKLTETIFAVEPPASYHKPLAEYLIEKQEQVVYVSNVAVAKNRALLDGRWDKNDKKDAANIADLGAIGGTPLRTGAIGGTPLRTCESFGTC